MSAMAPMALAMLSGALLALSLPPLNHSWLGWVALAPLFAATHKRRVVEAIGLGIVAAFTCGAVLVPWNPRAFGFEYAAFPFLLLALLLGASSPLMMLARRRWDGVLWAFFVAACGVVLEWVTTFAPIPLHLALCQHQNLPVLQLAAVTGIWGISFFLWLTNALAADALLQRRLRTAPIGVILGVAAGILLLSGIIPAPRGEKLRVAAVQDYAGAEGSVFGFEAEAGDRHELTRQAARNGARLIVWPELGLGSSFAPESATDETVRLTQKLGVYLVAGYSQPGTPKGFNCAALIAPTGEIKGIHRKNYPFLGERRDTEPGREARAFETDLGEIGIAICFDTCYTELPRRLVGSGARLMAMPNYDPVAPRGLVHHLHGAVLPFRAVENRVPIVRADANGMSQVISATGAVIAEAPLFRPAVVDTEVELGTGRRTLFARLGDWPVPACALILMSYLLAAVGTWRRRREAEKKAARCSSRR